MEKDVETLAKWLVIARDAGTFQWTNNDAADPKILKMARALLTNPPEVLRKAMEK